MTEPLRMSFDVACPPGHAFTVWTSGIGAWWPPEHTMTGRPAAVVLEGGVGGRLGYLWYLGRDRDGATEVEIRFLARGPGATRVEIEHRGWERLGADAGPWRDRNHRNWQSLLGHFVAAAGKAAEKGEQ